MIRNYVMPLAEECLIFVNRVEPNWVSVTSVNCLKNQFELISGQYWLIESAYVGPE
jgi:hypothetical protein